MRLLPLLLATLVASACGSRVPVAAPAKKATATAPALDDRVCAVSGSGAIRDSAGARLHVGFVAGEAGTLGDVEMSEGARRFRGTIEIVHCQGGRATFTGTLDSGETFSGSVTRSGAFVFSTDSGFTIDGPAPRDVAVSDTDLVI